MAAQEQVLAAAKGAKRVVLLHFWRVAQVLCLDHAQVAPRIVIHLRVVRFDRNVRVCQATITTALYVQHVRQGSIIVLAQQMHATIVVRANTRLLKARSRLALAMIALQARFQVWMVQPQ